MDEYLNYLNTIKNFHHAESHQSNYHFHQSHSNDNRDSHYHKERRGYQSNRNNDSYMKKKRHQYKEYKDLDEIETNQTQNNSTGRNLISYDDL